MWPLFELKDIRITDLDTLELGICGTREDLTGFAMRVLARDDIPTPAELEEFSGKVYPNPDLVKASRFAGLVLSMRDRGYRVLGINSDDCYYEENFRPYARVHPLVTVKEDTNILVDGNHRAASLLVLGVRFFPVIHTRQTLTESEKEHLENKEVYRKQYRDFLPQFLDSQEWKDYKATNCYKVAFND